MSDFLLELRSEEIPARMQVKAKADLERLFVEALAKAGLAAARIETFATPRRLALIAHDLPDATDAVSEETKGPKVGAPPQALEGFLRKTGLTQDQLVERDGTYFAVIDKPDRATAEVLTEAIPAIIRAFPWPKSMRWGAASAVSESLRWVRPLSGIVALLGDEILPCTVEGVASGRETMGHRFHSHGPVSIANAGAYVEALRAAHVIVHFSERCALIRDGAAKAAANAGLVLVEDEALVVENAGLTEWPVPLLGRFDAAFLEVPPEVIQLTARVNQKYFVCETPSRLREWPGEGVSPSVSLTGPPPTPAASGRGGLANAFICTANIAPGDGGVAIVDGNRKVLAARLSDARFFWEQDQKKTLAQHAEKLGNIVFHEKLGTVADKVDRVAKLARWLCEEGIVTDRSPANAGAQGDHAPPSALPSPGPRRSPGSSCLATLAEQAARLCKADLVTEMVGEFPELQGIMGGYYAAREGLDPEVAAAIRDHYKPVGQGDEVPTAPVTVAVSLADKLDTLVGFFCGVDRPTGSKDPYAQRRAAIALIQLINRNDVRRKLRELLVRVVEIYLRCYIDRASELDSAIKDYVDQRLSEDMDIVDIIYSFDKKSDDKDHEAYLDSLVARLKMNANGRHYLSLMSEFGFNVGQNGDDFVPFVVDRLKVQQREAGVRHDLIDAVFALGGEDDLVRLLARVKALQAFMDGGDGADLLSAYKRAANLLKQSEQSSSPADAGVQGVGEQIAVHGSPGLRLSPENMSEHDTSLLHALNHAEPAAAAAVTEERFTDAMAALASLRAPIDAFFEGVMVNDPDPAFRAFRLGLLARFTGAVHQVADFSKIEG